MFGIDLFDAGLAPAMLVALVAGVLSFLSPCVLPIVPPYLAYMGGISMPELREGDRAARRRILLPALFFVLGLSTVFLFLGFTASAFGAFFLKNQELFARISGAMVIVLGLHFLGVFRIPMLDREARLNAGDQGGSALGAYLLGLAFAFGWTPCIGPILAAILAVAGAQETVARGALLLAVYSLGLGLPFLIAGFAMGRFLAFVAQFRRHFGKVEKIVGVLLILTGVAFLTGGVQEMSFWLLETFPGLAALG